MTLYRLCSCRSGCVVGVFGVTYVLYDKFVPTRVIDTPISKSAIIGAASGAAVTGLRPVAELMFVDFVGVCLDQIYNQAAKFRYMFGRSEEHTSELQSLMRISYAVFCLKKKKK